MVEQWTRFAGAAVGAVAQWAVIDPAGLAVTAEDSTGTVTVIPSSSPYSSKAVQISTTAAAGEATRIRVPVVNGGTHAALNVVMDMPTIASGQWLHCLHLTTDQWAGLTVSLTQAGAWEITLNGAVVHTSGNGALPAAGTRIRVGLAAQITAAGDVTWRAAVHNDSTGLPVSAAASGTGTVASATRWEYAYAGKTQWESATNTTVVVRSIRAASGAPVGAVVPGAEPVDPAAPTLRRAGDPTHSTIWRKGSGQVTMARKPVVGAVTPVGGAPGPWALQFRDEFDTGTLNTSVWVPLRGAPGGTYNSPVNPSGDDHAYAANRVTVTNGMMRLAWDRTPITSYGVTYPYTAGYASTAAGLTVNAGCFIESRVQIGPANAGLWPALWLLPYPVNQWPPEVDIAEWVTSDTPDGLYHPHFNVHWQDSGGVNRQAYWQSYGPSGTNYLGSGWHTYGLLWRSNLMQVYLDGVAGPSYTGPGLGYLGDMYVVFSTGVMKGNTPANGSMDVDYLRVWRLT